MTSRYDIAIQSKNIPAMEFHAGDTLQIEGEFSFGQDHSFWRGEIPDTTFTVRGMVGVWVCLEAPGYGELGGHYGNGAIFVSPKELAKHAKILTRSTEPDKPMRIL